MPAIAPDGVDDAPGGQHRVSPHHPGAEPHRDRGRRQRRLEPVGHRQVEASRRGSPCCSSRPAPAIPSRPVRAAGGSPPASGGCSCRSRVRGRSGSLRAALRATAPVRRVRPPCCGCRRPRRRRPIAVGPGARRQMAGMRADQTGPELGGDLRQRRLGAAPGVVQQVGALERHGASDLSAPGVHRDRRRRDDGRVCVTRSRRRGAAPRPCRPPGPAPP